MSPRENDGGLSAPVPARGPSDPQAAAAGVGAAGATLVSPPPPPPSYTPPCCKRTLGAFTRPTLGLNHSRHSRHSTIAGTFRPKIAPGTATAAATATATATAAAADTATATATATGTASAATATTATTFIATHNWLRGPGQRAWLCQACVGLTLSSGGGGRGGMQRRKLSPHPALNSPALAPPPSPPQITSRAS